MGGLEVGTQKPLRSLLLVWDGFLGLPHTRAQKRPHHLPQTLKAKPQILLCYPPHKVRRINGGQGHPRVLPVPEASAGGIHRPLFDLELQGRVPLTPLALQVWTAEE